MTLFHEKAILRHVMAIPAELRSGAEFKCIFDTLVKALVPTQGPHVSNLSPRHRAATAFAAARGGRNTPTPSPSRPCPSRRATGTRNHVRVHSVINILTLFDLQILFFSAPLWSTYIVKTPDILYIMPFCNQYTYVVKSLSRYSPLYSAHLCSTHIVGPSDMFFYIEPTYVQHAL